LVRFKVDRCTVIYSGLGQYPANTQKGTDLFSTAEGNIFISNALAKRIQDAGIKNLLLVDATDTTAIA
jgi:hypothetical protein